MNRKDNSGTAPEVSGAMLMVCMVGESAYLSVSATEGPKWWFLGGLNSGPRFAVMSVSKHGKVQI